MRGTFSLRYGLFTLVLAVFTYLYALDSRFAPKNGDEYPYMHIVRMTAEAGNWLPLQSEMEGLKNGDSWPAFEGNALRRGGLGPFYGLMNLGCPKLGVLSQNREIKVENVVNHPSTHGQYPKCMGK